MACSFITISEIYPGSPLVEDSLFWAANLYHHFLGNGPLAERYYQQLMVRFPEGEHFHSSLEAVAELYAQQRETLYKAILTYRRLMLAEVVAARRDLYLLRIAEAYVGFPSRRGRTPWKLISVFLLLVFVVWSFMH